MTSKAWTKIAHGAQRAAHQLRVRSALHSMLWLCVVVMPICFCFARLSDDVGLKYLLTAGGLLPAIVTCWGFAYLTIHKPETLHSEDYQIRHEVPHVLQQRADPIPVDSPLMQAMANPHALVKTNGATADEGHSYGDLKR